MRKPIAHRLFFGCVLLAVSLSGFVAEAKAKTKIPEAALETPVWFMQGSSHGLFESQPGRLKLSDSTLTIPFSQRLFGAAYYKHQHSLIAVAKDGTVILFQSKNGRFREHKSFKPKFQARTLSVSFTRVPGLAYIHFLNVRRWAELHPKPRKSKGKPGELEPYVKSIQFSPYNSQRLTLLDNSQPWFAMPVGDGDEKLVGGCYKSGGRYVKISFGANRWLKFQLSAPLDGPINSGSHGQLRQAIFAFPKKGLLAITRDAWVLLDFKGRLKHSYPTKNIKYASWDSPTLVNGKLYVHLNMGPRSQHYRLGDTNNRMIETKE